MMTEAGPQKLIATTDEKSDAMNMVNSASAFSEIVQYNSSGYEDEG